MSPQFCTLTLPFAPKIKFLAEQKVL